MKKRSFVVLLLAVLMLCSLVGCGEAAQDPESRPEATQPENSGELLSLSLEEPPADALLCVDAVESYNYTLKLTANQEILNLRFMTIDPDSSLIDETLYSLPALTKGESLYIRTYVNDANPNRGIACTDQQGKTHSFAFVYSGKDGSVSLNRLENTPLTADELKAIETYLNKMENNGFVGGLNLYDAPEQISLEWALYDGAGVGQWVSDWDEAEKQALLTANGWEEIYVPVMKYPAAAVEQLVQERLGISMELLEKPFELSYLEEYDAYYHMHSDTNYLPVTVLDGTVAGDVYTVSYQGFDEEVFSVVLRKTGEDQYQFISNQLIEKD